MVVETLTRTFNWFDVAVLGLILMYVWQGWEKGVYLTLSEAFSWLVAWWAGVSFSDWFSASLVTYLGLHKAGAWLVGFVVVVVAVQQGIYGVLKWLFHSLPRQNFSPLGQWLFGVFPMFVSGVLLAAFVVTTLLILPFDYPLKGDITQSWFGSEVVKWAGNAGKRF